MRAPAGRVDWGSGAREGGGDEKQPRGECVAYNWPSEANATRHGHSVTETNQREEFCPQKVPLKT